jgi:hypothetical protein
MAEDAPVTTPPARPDLTPPASPWATTRGSFLVVTQACGCPVKVRDEAAAERMAVTTCRKHTT